MQNKPQMPPGLTKSERWIWERASLKDRRRMAWAANVGNRKQIAYQRDPLYIRFGDPPASGRSTTYRDLREKLGHKTLPARYDEAGVSCFRAREAKSGYEIEPDSPQVATSLYLIRHRPCYLAVGEEIGLGVGGEPLLTNIELVKSIEKKDWRGVGAFYAAIRASYEVAGLFNGCEYGEVKHDGAH